MKENSENFFSVQLVVGFSNSKVAVKGEDANRIMTQDEGQERQEAKTTDCQDDKRLETF
jgi:hypothetical protein